MALYFPFVHNIISLNANCPTINNTSTYISSSGYLWLTQQTITYNYTGCWRMEPRKDWYRRKLSIKRRIEITFKSTSGKMSSKDCCGNVPWAFTTLLQYLQGDRIMCIYKRYTSIWGFHQPFIITFCINFQRCKEQSAFA